MSDYTAKRVGMIQLYRGKYDDAVKYLTDAYNSNPKDPSVLYNLSRAYLKKREFKSALGMIDKCLIVNPGYPGSKELKEQILNLSK